MLEPLGQVWELLWARGAPQVLVMPSGYFDVSKLLHPFPQG